MNNANSTVGWWIKKARRQLYFCSDYLITEDFIYTTIRYNRCIKGWGPRNQIDKKFKAKKRGKTKEIIKGKDKTKKVTPKKKG